MSNASGEQRKLEDVLQRRPDFVKDTPLDSFFENLQREFLSPLRTSDGLNIYERIGCQDNGEFVTRCVERLTCLHGLAVEREQGEGAEHKLLPISLHDMKFFDELINLLIVHGVYANLPQGFGVPLQQRQLSQFKDIAERFQVPGKHVRSATTLEVASRGLYIILSQDRAVDTVRDILLKGAGYIDALMGFIALRHDRPQRQEEYDNVLEKLESIQDTYRLLSIYSLLVQSTCAREYLEWPLQQLSTLTVRRDDGVASLVDFVVGLRDEEQVSIEKFDRVKQILLAKPKSLSNVEYFHRLFKQIYTCLADVNRPVLISCLNSVLVGFYYKNKRIVYDFLFQRVARILFNVGSEAFSEKQLNDCFNVLISLSKSSSTELIGALVQYKGAQSFYFHLWVYGLFLRKNQTIQPVESEAKYYMVVFSLLNTFVKLTGDFEALERLVPHLVNFDHETWRYAINLETHLPYVLPKSGDENAAADLNLHDAPETGLSKIQQLFSSMDFAVEAFIELLNLLGEEEVRKNIFLQVLRRWVEATSKSESVQQTAIGGDSVSHNLLALVDLKLLEKMHAQFKDDIISRPHDILRLVADLLVYSHSQEDEHSAKDSDDEDSEDEEAAAEPAQGRPFSILLDLLSATLLSAPPADLVSEQPTLQLLAERLQAYPADASCRALQLRIRDVLARRAPAPGADAVGAADNAAFSRALANVNDALPSLRAHGLYELRRLIERGSPSVDLTRVLDLHFLLLRDPEPFVYLNAIKGLSTLCLSATATALPALLARYHDPQGRMPLDHALRLAEALAAFIPAQNELLQGPHAAALVETCLSKVRARTADARLRMSALSLLGLCVRTNPLGVAAVLPDILDCALGVLQLEPVVASDDRTPLVRRAAAHLIHDLLSASGLDLLPPSDLRRLADVVRNTATNEKDYLTAEPLADALQLLEGR
ncbi:FAFL147Cp [Eremothecium gossypii FDAG1]|nr:FAFL147Cp [Eremothecium gossypii FDAG1]